MLPTVSSKPVEMSDANWRWLQSLHFGTVIFSNPRKGMMFMPERIAKGDLDGDLYFVCWDENVLNHIETEPMENIASDDNCSLSTVPTNPNWFREAQDLMVDCGLVNTINRLTGTFSRKAEEIARNSSDMLRHPDSSWKSIFRDNYCEICMQSIYLPPNYLIIDPRHIHLYFTYPQIIQICSLEFL